VKRGTNKGVLLRVLPFRADHYEVAKNLRVPTTSAKHMALYTYLERHGDAANSDLTTILGPRYGSQTSKFLTLFVLEA
jgi:hypothetical protein